MEPVLGTVVLATAAGVSFATAAIADLHPHHRLAVALVGAGLDWLPLGLGWMWVAGSPAPWLVRTHLGFGLAGYALLTACAADWVRGVDRPRPIRLAFLGMWTIGYLAGVVMVWSIGG